MKRPAAILFQLSIVLLIGLGVETQAQTAGKLVGRVLDQSGQAPLAGVNLMLAGTYLGAATDAEGNYLLLNVPPGRYTLVATMIGYARLTVEGVEITSGLTTRQNLGLQQEAIAGQVVTITATRPLVQKDVTSSTNFIGSEQIAALPATDYRDLLLTMPGILQDSKGLHLRGGRSGEVSLLVDGVRIQEPNYGTSFAGYSALTMNNDAISQAVVQSGGFNAEFGNALSGVVEITSVGGSDQFAAWAEVESELAADPGRSIPESKRDSRYYDGVGRDSTRYDYATGFRRYRLGLSGPLPWFRRFTYSLNAQGTQAEDGFPTRENTENDLREEVYNAKLTVALTPRLTVTGSGMLTKRRYWLYDIRRKFIPQTNQRRTSRITHGSLEVRHSLGPQSFYTLLAGGSSTYYKAAQPGKWWDITQPEEWNVLDPTDPGDTLNSAAVNIGTTYLPGTQYIIEGDNNLFREERIGTLVVKGALTHQAGPHHQLKGGFEINYYDLYYQAVLAYKGFPFTFAHGLDNDRLGLPALNPWLLGIFIQDKIEFEGLIVNLGLRQEVFEPDARLPSDWLHPYLDEGAVGPGLDDIANWKGPDHDIPSINPDHPWKPASRKIMLSPRVGVSHPITDVNVLHYSYGIFQQIPDWYLLYRNYNMSYDILALYGNPDIRPEQTTSFEVGLRSALAGEWVVDVTAFFKDISDLVETTAINDINDPAVQTALAADSSVVALPTWFINKNVAWGTVKGFELVLQHRQSRRLPLGLNITYTFMIARGKTSDYHDGFLRQFTRGQLDPVQQYYLGWDQRHTLVLGLDYRWRENAGVNLLWRYGSGYPYTGFQESILPEENNKRLPATSIVDLKLNHELQLGRYRLTPYLFITNLFDSVNIYNFDSGENRRIPVINHLLDHPDEFEGPLDDPLIFGPHREIRFGLEVRL